MNRINLLRHHGVTPYLVFDGDYLPSKKRVESSRLQQRKEHLQSGLQHISQGKQKAAYESFKSCIDVTPEMAYNLICTLRREKVKYIVAPYEADAQLAYLERIGEVSAVLTEDSDLLVFGCQKVLIRLEKDGYCTQVDRSDFGHPQSVCLRDLDDELFRHMAILSGCDYLKGIPQIGLKTAYRLLIKYGKIERVLKHLRMEGYQVPADYENGFRLADATFKYQLVYCPNKRQLVMWNEPIEKLEEDIVATIGDFLDPYIAESIAIGERNPFTKELFRNENIRQAPPIKSKSKLFITENASANTADNPQKRNGPLKLVSPNTLKTSSTPAIKLAHHVLGDCSPKQTAITSHYFPKVGQNTGISQDKHKFINRSSALSKVQSQTSSPFMSTELSRDDESKQDSEAPTLTLLPARKLSNIFVTGTKCAQNSSSPIPLAQESMTRSWNLKWQWNNNLPISNPSKDADQRSSRPVNGAVQANHVEHGSKNKASVSSFFSRSTRVHNVQSSQDSRKSDSSSPPRKHRKLASMDPEKFKKPIKSTEINGNELSSRLDKIVPQQSLQS